MALMPPVSAISGTIGAVLCGERAIDGAGDFGRAGEGDAGDARIGDQAAPTVAVAGNEMQRARRHAGVVQQRNGERGDQRRLLGRLGDHRIAGGERGGRPGRGRSRAGNSTG